MFLVVANQTGGGQDGLNPFTGRRCYFTKGLLGTYDGDRTDDLMNPDGSIIRVSGNVYNPSETQMIYEQFGIRCELSSAIQ